MSSKNSKQQKSVLKEFAEETPSSPSFIQYEASPKSVMSKKLDMFAGEVHIVKASTKTRTKTSSRSFNGSTPTTLDEAAPYYVQPGAHRVGGDGAMDNLFIEVDEECASVVSTTSNSRRYFDEPSTDKPVPVFVLDRESIWISKAPTQLTSKYLSTTPTATATEVHKYRKHVPMCILLVTALICGLIIGVIASEKIVANENRLRGPTPAPTPAVLLAPGVQLENGNTTAMTTSYVP